MWATLVRVWLCALAVVGILSTSQGALASNTRVLLLRPGAPSALLSEALVYVQGELGSVQLEPTQAIYQMRQPSAAPIFQPGTYGALVFMEQGGILTIEAYRPDVPEPIIQRIDTRDGRITPQVVAIRAVEALRAAMQHLVRSRPKDDASVPEAVQRFARVNKQARAQGQGQGQGRAQPPGIAESEGSERSDGAPQSPFEVGVWTAPQLMLDPKATHPFFGMSASLVAGKSWLFGVARFETTLTPLEFQEDFGRAEVGRLGATGRLRLRGTVTEHLGAYFDLGGGVARFEIEGFANPGFEANRQRHTTPIGVASMGIDYWAARYLGFFVESFGSVALDAPAVGVASAERRRLERPLLGAAVGIALSYR